MKQMKHKTIGQLRDRKAKENGATVVLVTVFLVALFAFAGLSVDVGNVIVQRTRLQEAGDSASMASVVDWATGSTADVVAQHARSFASANGVLTGQVKTVRVGKWVQSTRTFVEQGTFSSSEIPAVEVTNQRTVPMVFGKVVGIPAMSPRTVSVAAVAASSGVGGALPISMCILDSPPSKCDIVTVKFKGGNACATFGNYDSLSLGANGADVYRDNIHYGYQSILRVGDIVQSEPGGMVGPTKQGLKLRLDGVPPYTCTPTSLPPNNARLAYIPVTTPYTKNGKAELEILGFYAVAVRDYTGGGDISIQFLNVFSGTEIDPSKPPVSGFVNGVALVK